MLHYFSFLLSLQIKIVLNFKNIPKKIRILKFLHPLMINVDRSSNDPFFRYQMPPVQVSFESNKTIITSLESISKSLYREPAHILKYIGMTIGCNQSIEHGKYGLNGNYEANRLQQIVYDYVDLFVLCRVCRNPETKFVYEGGILKRSCASCGSVEIQPQHKLNAVIIKDINKIVNTDSNYDKPSDNILSKLIKEENDNTERIYEIYKQESIKLSEIFNEYIKPGNLKQISKILKEEKLSNILQNIETMLEANNKEDKLPLFLKAICKLGFSFDDIDEYFSVNPKGKKRSPLIKKNAEYFLDNYENK